jgi:hypothetical protein
MQLVLSCRCFKFSHFKQVYIFLYKKKLILKYIQIDFEGFPVNSSLEKCTSQALLVHQTLLENNEGAAALVPVYTNGLL